MSNNRIVKFTLDNSDPTPGHIIEQGENQNGEIELLVNDAR
jgi:hypothetical protein